MGGDRPVPEITAGTANDYTPRGRGSTAYASDLNPVAVLCPAWAGIHPLLSCTLYVWHWFPRPRGDRPLLRPEFRISVEVPPPPRHLATGPLPETARVPIGGRPPTRLQHQGCNANLTVMPVNVCREKKITNMRSSTAEIAKRLSPPVRLSLEEALDFVSPTNCLKWRPSPTGCGSGS